MIRHLHLDSTQCESRERVLSNIFIGTGRLIAKDHDRITDVDENPPLRTPWPDAEPERPVSTTTYTIPSRERTQDGETPPDDVLKVTVFQDGTTAYEDTRDGIALTRRGLNGPHQYHRVDNG